MTEITVEMDVKSNVIHPSQESKHCCRMHAIKQARPIQCAWKNHLTKSCSIVTSVVCFMILENFKKKKILERKSLKPYIWSFLEHHIYKFLKECIVPLITTVFCLSDNCVDFYGPF